MASRDSADLQAAAQSPGQLALTPALQSHNDCANKLRTRERVAMAWQAGMGGGADLQAAVKALDSWHQGQSAGVV